MPDLVLVFFKVVGVPAELGEDLLARGETRVADAERGVESDEDLAAELVPHR